MKEHMRKKIVVIGSGFSGLSAACFLAQAGLDVTVIEKHDQPGGRARRLQEGGYTFDMGPSWYWMPDVFERFFAAFGKGVGDYYALTRLDPSYRVFWNDGPMDIPADYAALRSLFESLEPGSGAMLDKYLREAQFKYETGMHRLVYKPGRSITEFADVDLVKGLFRLDVFTNAQKHIARHFKHPKLRQLLEFPLLFLGALAEDTPALYSLMNYADMKLGTWYPEGGIYAVVSAMYELARSLGVRFCFGHNAEKILVRQRSAYAVQTDKEVFKADLVVGSADYQFIESRLLDAPYRSYTQQYWDSRVMAPSCLIYYVGINKRLPGLEHHSLFFDVPFAAHADDIYRDPSWPGEPLFYVSCTSRTDGSVCPEGHEALFILIPVAAGMPDTEAIRQRYFDIVIRRMEEQLGEPVMQHVDYCRSYAHADFCSDYNAFKGNAYGLANTLRQTAILKPSLKSRKVNNLFYTGQLTTPGPGVPPAIISGQVVAGEIIKSLSSKRSNPLLSTYE
jgi:phytoene desaturase